MALIRRTMLRSTVEAKKKEAADALWSQYNEDHEEIKDQSFTTPKGRTFKSFFHYLLCMLWENGLIKPTKEYEGTMFYKQVWINQVTRKELNAMIVSITKVNNMEHLFKTSYFCQHYHVLTYGTNTHGLVMLKRTMETHHVKKV